MGFRIATDDRYARLRLCADTPPERLRAARWCVVGVGALGNEVVKTAALLGVGHLTIVDPDDVTVDNLTRAVLFRADDAGRPKAVVAAARVRELNPDVAATAVRGAVPFVPGLEVLAAHDVVLGCTDSREARVAANALAFRAGLAYVDGALGERAGTVRVFRPPDGPCYECGLTAADRALLAARAPCGVLGQAAAAEGRMPTTPMVAAVVAAFQVDAALRLLAGDARDAGTALVWHADGPTLYRTRLTSAPECPAHETWPAAEPLPLAPATTTAATLLATVAARWPAADAAPPVLRLTHTWVASARCVGCGRAEPVRRLHAAIHAEGRAAACRACGALREPETVHAIAPDSPHAGETLAALGIPDRDVVRVARGAATMYVGLTGDGAGAPGSGPCTT